MHPEIKQHAQTVFSYLFGLISKYEFRARVGDKNEAKSVWNKVVNNGYVLCNCKLYLYALHKARGLGQTVSYLRYDIDSSDVKLLKSINLTGVPYTFKAYSLAEFGSLETELLTSSTMNVYIGKFISKKLIFLTRSYNQQRQEIEGSLKIAGLYALRKQYPFFKSELHALNICKTSISNAGKGLIEFWTRDKRNALMRENGTFQAVSVQYEVQKDLAVQPEHADEKRMNIQALCAISTRLPARQRDWVSAAAGLYDKGFSFYIGRDNTDAIEYVPYEKYLNLLCDYHAIGKDMMINNLKIALT